MDEVLVAEEVRKTYGGGRRGDEVVALDGVSLTVEEGEVFGLIGPNGAGKTTLVRALTGTTRFDGSIRVLDSSLDAVDPQRIGLLPQSFSPPNRLTARELVAYYAGLYDESRDPDEVLADVGLADAADTWYEKLSGGQQRRVCVGSALVNDPDVLFLDEPTTGIDPAGRRALWSLLEDLAASGTTVFLTSHSMDEVERLADRAGLLSDGSLVAVGSPEELIAEHGGVSRLIVRSEAGTDAIADARYAVEATADELVFHEVAPEEIGDVVGTLDRAGVTYESFTWTEPTLEDVYLRLTGEAFEGGTPTRASAGERGAAPAADAGGAR